MKLATIIGGAGLVIAFSSLLASAGAAAPLTVTSYDMPNGGTGSFTYWDDTYTPCGGSACVTTGAALSGGTGKLTDGFTSNQNWNADSPSWVGWDTGQPNGANPAITFHFAGPKTINAVTVWVDNSLGYGGVSLPASVSIDGVNHPITPDSSDGSPRGYTFGGLNLTGSSVNVQFFQSNSWIMVGEVSFDGTSGVPEPAAWTMMLVGLGAMGARLRSSRRQTLASAG